LAKHVGFDRNISRIELHDEVEGSIVGALNCASEHERLLSHNVGFSMAIAKSLRENGTGTALMCAFFSGRQTIP
jgi:hypothetical protein